MRIITTSLLLLFIFAAKAQVVSEESDFLSLANSSDEKSLPLVNINTDIAAVNSSEYTPATVEIFDLRERTMGERLSRFNCKVKYRGASSLSYEKKSFAVKLFDEAGEDLDANIFGIREENSWILDAMAIDRIRMRNRVCFDFWNQIDKLPYKTDYGSRNGTEGVFVEVFINGNYHGLYCMTDKIDRKLLGLKKAKKEDSSDITVRGLLYKGDSWTNAVNLVGYDNDAPTDKTTWEGYGLQYPDDCPSEKTWKPLMDFIDFFQSPISAFSGGYTEYINKENLADYAMLFVFFNYRDAPVKNAFLSAVDITKGHQFLITPWDMDTSLGGDWDGAYYNRPFVFNVFVTHMLFKMFYNDNIDGFKDDVRRKYYELSKSVLTKENFNKHVDMYADMFTESGAWRREYDRWNNNPVPLYENIQDEIRYVKDWFASNQSYVESILGPDTGSGIATIPFAHSGSEQYVEYNIDGTPTANNICSRGVVVKAKKKILRTINR